MSSLRQRIFGTPTPASSRETTPPKGEPVRLAPVSKIKRTKESGRKRRNGFMFGLGGLFGILIAAFFANKHDVIRFDSIGEISFENLIDVIPASILKEAKDITVGNLGTLGTALTKSKL